MFAFVVGLCLLVVPALASAQHVTLGEFTTKFNTKGENADRAHNVLLAAQAIDGVVLNPGQTFSYNSVVGQRTERAGYRKAHAIVKNQLVDQYGGGVCQVSGTLHAAALRAGLAIVEHHPHSRVSLYIVPLFDATVDYGRRDLKIMNDTSEPVKIIADTSVSGVLTVKFVAARRTRTVSIETVVTNKVQFKTHRYHVKYLPPGRVKKIEPGTIGCDVVRIRTIVEVDTGRQVVETVRHHYDDSDRIVHVGRSAESRLYPLVDPHF